MTSFILLCDPAILLPPDTSDPDRGVAFWQRLITWSADHRVRLGPTTLDLVHATFADLGWPNYDPPGCPTALKRVARRSLNGLLARVQLPTDSHPTIAVVPTLMPNHRSGDLVEEAIGHDAATLWMMGVLGIATDRSHWAPPADAVAFDPPPPDMLDLIDTPLAHLDEEIDSAVAGFLRGRRLTIVGGCPRPELSESLCARFELDAAQVHWIGSERGQRLNLDSLDGLQADRDVVVCVTGHIGHAGSRGVKARCRRREIELLCVHDQNQIADELRRLPTK